MLPLMCSTCDDFAKLYMETYTRCGEPTCAVCSRHKSLRNQMVEAKERYDTLVKEYRSLRPTINQVHKSLVDRLPVEVISLVFEYYTEKTFAVQEVACPELTLGAVCQNWRRIAWATPSLWTSLTFYFRDTTSPEQIEIAVEWLKRSGRLPVSIFLSKREPAASLNWKLYLAKPLLQAVSECSDRWSMLAMFMPSSFVSYVSDAAGASPALGRLDIEPSNWASLNIPSAAPEYLYLSNIPFKDISMKWDKVRDLDTTSSFTACECILMLGEAVNASRCLFQPRVRGTTVNALGMVTHTNLRSLQFTMPTDENDPTLFFDHVSLPALKDLDLDLEGSQLPMPSLTAFLQRASPSLDSLYIRNPDTTSPALIDVLGSIPSVSDLSIDFYGANADHETLRPFYWAFEPRIPASGTFTQPEHQPILPHLKKIYITGEFTTVPDELIASLFSHFHSQDTTSTTCRPLERIIICCTAINSEDSGGPWQYMTRPTLDQVAFLREKVIDVRIMDCLAEDLVKLSLESLGLESGPYLNTHAPTDQDNVSALG